MDDTLKQILKELQEQNRLLYSNLLTTQDTLIKVLEGQAPEASTFQIKYDALQDQKDDINRLSQLIEEL